MLILFLTTWQNHARVLGDRVEQGRVSGNGRHRGGGSPLADRERQLSHAQCEILVERAIERGELPAQDTDARSLLIAATAPLYHQLGRVSSRDQWVVQGRSLIQIIEARR